MLARVGDRHLEGGGGGGWSWLQFLRRWVGGKYLKGVYGAERGLGEKKTRGIWIPWRNGERTRLGDKSFWSWGVSGVAGILPEQLLL